MQSYIKIRFHFKCIIGILDFERKKKQKVIIKLKAKSHEFLDYSKIIAKIKKYYKTQQFYTLEESLHSISLNLKNDFPSLTHLKIEVFKPHILKNAKVGVKLKKKY
ncbi:dihydroneopterin aldolase [Campylobacter sp. VicNov18]|uniref:dihydroneopterin aldolase n=1 Tax=Campylobacter bilis TaxID=2691918 RepID=UPI00130EE39D|nr:dihydroneopterin aldolase [Campylobacter bilis]MPV63303.1 dihydroneopterin aldolase [Campylobacter hepaticus]MBM0636802.1 dihydroneopterin aldolase [Campylobacter bilis]MCC8277374.1 dihydroneopterin aldolase [Campylobacter bilis]MCC8299117.1 dihydroneopterin aldolase [Campylobacter bilis]MCC8300283.1 dihydroneopterin aldolase [Campylobacter bilis]